MRNISDYIFSYSKKPSDRDPKTGQEYLVLTDIGELRKGALVKCVGFADIDNHYGIQVFTGANDEILEVAGDYSGGSLLEKLKSALTRTE